MLRLLATDGNITEQRHHQRLRKPALTSQKRRVGHAPHDEIRLRPRGITHVKPILYAFEEVARE
jgi:hypothetical protein